LAVFEIVLRDLIAEPVPDVEAEDLWRGHRTFLTDGSGVSMPDLLELRNQFGQSGAGGAGKGVAPDPLRGSGNLGIHRG